MTALVFGSAEASAIVAIDRAIRSLELLTLEGAEFDDWWVRAGDMSEEEAAAAAYLHKRGEWRRRKDIAGRWEYSPNYANRARLMDEWDVPLNPEE